RFLDIITTMKKGILLSIFVVIGAGVIAWGTWYANTVLQTTPTATSNTTATANPDTTTATATSNPQQITSTSSPDMDGLQITDSVVGTGTVAQAGDTVTVNYIGKLDN